MLAKLLSVRLLITLMVGLSIASLSRAADAPIKVFVLAGQSNMEGKAKVSLLEYQIKAPETAKLFAHLHKDGEWIERDDVFIKFLDRSGKLTVGYGSRGCIGPELGFGHTMGDHFSEPVLLIKTAWGGKSLYRDFRPPSSGLPSEEERMSLLTNARKQKPETTMDDINETFGHFYREMIQDVNNTIKDLDTYIPGARDRGYEIAGFVWFQGWNDMINTTYTAEYADNMANFIRDVRKDLGTPKLPFVIGQLGVGGTEANQNAKHDAFKEAQAAPAKRPEFVGNVALVKTDVFWDQEADAVFKKGWRENLEEWNKVGSDYPFHYLGSAKCHLRMGNAFAEAILRLREMRE